MHGALARSSIQREPEFADQRRAAPVGLQAARVGDWIDAPAWAKARTPAVVLLQSTICTHDQNQLADAEQINVLCRRVHPVARRATNYDSCESS
jgi:hypothetical protein